MRLDFQITSDLTVCVDNNTPLLVSGVSGCKRGVDGARG